MASLNRPIHDWHGKRVWLFGASTGIGAALALELARRGARLALSSRTETALTRVATTIREKLATATPAPAEGLAAPLLLPCDASADASVDMAWTRLMAEWGGVDVAIYLAGDYQPMRADAIDLAVARRLIEVNLMGAIAFTARVAPQLVQQGAGHIALTASVAGYCGLPKSLVYGASKAALINFTESMYLDLSPAGVGVSVINPGFVATPLTAQNDFRMPALQTPEQAAAAIVDGFARGDFAIEFPKRFTRTMKALAALPYRLFFPLVRRFTGV
ncbi:SDR family NAD(P)-dependent oxidoreductase [Rhodocyclus tenuis]|uniref:SDR family NAD(P)-dependent oxidoreductase n=2 Tax=Rhodocyclus TaxID=1064 RepID=A0A6L5K054_RHOTE|nr:SDR family NAD(P)-dependent oxidoreductase [Rhodocyclus gracilis]MQY52721.1 SDR family NAD(P)-dependent oxidoreductase [Rhodocyclus gracilis]MRD74105.1 SDR family NAD(P)-dependent oxidoreductase [Rhodocyclus gracilis]NJA90191.1 SDR family NAD(P)-dependent oxidoreductase [Rhodocyclus gracilis]